MSTSTKKAEELVRAGDAKAALVELQAAVRSNASDMKLRVFLFQLLTVLGQWDRALNQLSVCAELDPIALGMQAMYRDAIGCEKLRAEVFAGKKSPMLFGEPQPWLALLIESLIRGGMGDHAAASQLRDQAFEQAPETSGSLDGQPFAWIADGDMRLGPVLEAVVNGRYTWIPYARLLKVTIEAPTDLRDFVWIPASLEFSNGGQIVALLPVRYPGSEVSDDSLLAMGRKTIWEQDDAGHYRGLGQRVFNTDGGEFPILQVREIKFDSTPESDDSLESDPATPTT